MRCTITTLLISAALLATVACTSPSSSATPAVASTQIATTQIATTSGGPSEAAQMVCSNTVRQSIATTLALNALPSSTTTWRDRLYTCTYALPTGPLVMRVKEFDTVPAAQQYIESVRADTAAAPIVGLANLGLPAYRSDRGVVLFLKDAMTLEVDASALPAHIGPQSITPADFAYQLATGILGCWTGH